MHEFVIRPAVPDDWAVLVEFNCRLAAESEGKQLDRLLVELGVRALLADASKGRYFVACVAEQVVGQLMHTFEWSDWRNGQIWWLQSVYVVPEFRRRGVFRRLFEHVAQLAESDPGVVGLRLYVEQANHVAHATYRGMGLHEGGYFVMERLFERTSP